MSWLWTALLACAVALVVAAEWPRLAKHAGFQRQLERKRPRRRRRRKPHLEVVPTDTEEFAASVSRDLDALPTIEEHERRRPT